MFFKAKQDIDHYVVVVVVVIIVVNELESYKHKID